MTYSLFHIKGTFGVTIVSTFSVNYQSITLSSTNLVDPPPMGTFFMKHALEAYTGERLDGLCPHNAIKK